MNPRPNIQVAPDIRVDDLFATHLVRQMLAAIEHDTHAHLAKLQSRPNGTEGNLGNPKGQRRYYKRLEKDFGPALLAIGLDRTGTNKRFAITTDIWMRGEGHTKNWLLGVRLRLIGRGANRPCDFIDTVMAGFTHHGLVRLVQRGKCSRPEDLTTILYRAWGMLQLMIRVRNIQGLRVPGEADPGWLLPVEGMNGERICLVVKAGKGPEPALVVTTVLTNKMLVDPTGPFELLREITERHGQDYLAMSNDPGISEALEATSKASRRGAK